MLELMDELLSDSSQSPEGMRSRARELREEAETTEIEPYAEAALVLADRYEAVAAEHLARAET